MRITLMGVMIAGWLLAGGAMGVLAAERAGVLGAQSGAMLSEEEKATVQEYLKQTLKGRLPQEPEQAQKMIDEEIKAREKMVRNIESQMPKKELLKALMKWSSQEVLVNAWMYEQQNSMRAAVSEKELKDDYEVMYPMERHVDLIIGIYKDEKKAQDILKRAQKGEALSALSKQSDDDKIAQKEGRLDSLPLISLPKQLQEVLDIKNVGSIVPKVIKTEYGFMVVQLMDVKDQRAKDFGQAREELINARIQMQMKQLMENVLLPQNEKAQESKSKKSVSNVQ